MELRRRRRPDNDPPLLGLGANEECGRRPKVCCCCALLLSPHPRGGFEEGRPCIAHVQLASLALSFRAERRCGWECVVGDGVGSLFLLLQLFRYCRRFWHVRGGGGREVGAWQGRKAVVVLLRGNVVAGRFDERTRSSSSFLFCYLPTPLVFPRIGGSRKKSEICAWVAHIFFLKRQFLLG